MRNKWIQSVHKLLPVIGVAMICSSCVWINTAGHLWDKAGYNAAADPSEVAADEKVYSDGSHYYIKLPRYRVAPKVYTLRGSWIEHKDEDKVITRKTGRKTLFEIPADYAMYLAGRSSGPVRPSSITEVKNDTGVLKKCTVQYNIVRRPAPVYVAYRHHSPNAALWYTASVFDWLCVDLPVNVTLNTGLCMGFIWLMGNSSNKTVPGSGYSDYDESYEDRAARESYQRREREIESYLITRGN